MGRTEQMKALLGFQKYYHSSRHLNLRHLWSIVFYCQIWHIIALSKKLG
jgi:hypothetical protein